MTGSPNARTFDLISLALGASHSTTAAYFDSTRNWIVRIIDDLRKQLTEAQRKAEQGSQKEQGNVFEIDIEADLKATFPHDSIERCGTL